MEIFLNKKWTSGFSLIEIMIVIGIIGMISSVVLSSFGQYRARLSKDGAVETAVSVISQAHLDTIASKNDSVYGVNLKQSEIIYFKGSVYPGDNDANNIHYQLPNSVEIANVNLNGGTSVLYFIRLTGATNNYGTFDVRVRANTSLVNTVTINQTGATSI